VKIKALNCFFSFLILGVTGCDNQGVSLSKERYRDIILDLQVAETIVSNSTVKNKDSLRQALQLRISEIYGFKDITALKESLLPLETNPELMLEITKEMNKKLDQLEDTLSTGLE
jgi:hypothetical protein